VGALSETHSKNLQRFQNHLAKFWEMVFRKKTGKSKMRKKKQWRKKKEEKNGKTCFKN